MQPCIELLYLDINMSEHSLSVICRCWLSSQNGTHWAFFTPGILVALVSNNGPVRASRASYSQLQPAFCISYVLRVCLRMCGFCTLPCVHSYSTHCSYMQYFNINFTNCFVCHILHYCFLLLYMYIMYVQYLHTFYTYWFVFLLRTYVLAILSFSHYFVSTCTVTCTYILVLTSL